MKYTVALGQLDSQDNRLDNLTRMEKMCREARKKGASLIAFPETAPYIGKRCRASEGEKIGQGAVSIFLSALSRDLKMFILCGSLYETSDQDKPFNTSVLYNDEGNVCAAYRKTHLFDVELPDGTQVRESRRYTPGDGYVVADTKLGTLGFSVCYDLRFPEMFRLQAMQGAEVIFIPADFTKPTGEAHWEILLRARAIENGCYIVAPCQTGKKPAYESYGNSMVIDPWGNILCRGTREEELLFAEIDTDMVKTTRQKLGCLDNVRSDLYKLSCDVIRKI